MMMLSLSLLTSSTLVQEEAPLVQNFIWVCVFSSMNCSTRPNANTSTLPVREKSSVSFLKTLGQRLLRKARHISGAMYSDVQPWQSCSWSPTLAEPKSVILIFRSSVTQMFSAAGKKKIIQSKVSLLNKHNYNQ